MTAMQDDLLDLELVDQGVAGCCSLLQGVAECCSVLQSVVGCFSVLQCVAVADVYHAG